METTTNSLQTLTLAQLQERARLNQLRGIAVSKELREEIARREEAKPQEPRTAQGK